MAIQKRVINPTDDLLSDYIKSKISEAQGPVQNLTGDLEHHLITHGLILPNSTPRKFNEAKATAWCKKNEGATESLGILAVMLNNKTTCKDNNSNIDALLRIRGAPGGVRNSDALMATLSGVTYDSGVSCKSDLFEILEFLKKEKPPQYQRPPLLNDPSIHTIINELKSHANAWEVFAAIDPMAWQHMSDSEVTTGPLHGRPGISNPLSDHNKQQLRPIFGQWKKHSEKEGEMRKATQAFRELQLDIKNNTETEMSEIPPLDELIQKKLEKEAELQGAIKALEDKQKALETTIKEINVENSEIDRYQRNNNQGDGDLDVLPEHLRNMIKARQSMGNAGLSTAPINGIIDRALGTIQSNNHLALTANQEHLDTVNDLIQKHEHQLKELNRNVDEFTETHNQKAAELKAQQVEIENKRGVLEKVRNGHHKPSEDAALREYIEGNQKKLKAHKEQRATFEAKISHLKDEIGAKQTEIDAINAEVKDIPIVNRPVNNADLNTFKEGLKTALYKKNPLQPEKILNALLHGLNEGTDEGLNQDQLTTLVKEVWEKIPWTKIFTGDVELSSLDEAGKEIRIEGIQEFVIESLLQPVKETIQTTCTQYQQTNPTIAELLRKFELNNLKPPLSPEKSDALNNRAKQFLTFKAAEKKPTRG